MDIKKIFINCMIVLCAGVIVLSVATALKRNAEPKDDDVITHNLMENSEIFVEEVDSTESTEVVVEDGAETTKTYYTSSKVNVRTGPATTYDVIIELPLGAEVVAIGEPDENGWQKIDYNGQEAYVLGTYLSETSPEEVDEDEQEGESAHSQQTQQSGQTQQTAQNLWEQLIQQAGSASGGGAVVDTTATPETPTTSEETPTTSEETSTTPEETPTTPEEAPSTPEETPTVPEETPTVPETPAEP